MSGLRQIPAWRRQGGAGGRCTVLVLMLALTCWLPPATLLACRYNVRDVGFVDLETESYRLCIFVPPGTPAPSLALLQRMPPVALRDCNIHFELLTPEGAAGHPAFPPPSRTGDDPTVRAVLESPDGRSLPLTFSQRGQPLRQRLAAVLDEVASSPKREELVAAAGRSFAAVLLIEGAVAEANRRAREAITTACDAIREQMQTMPKAIAQPPTLVVLEPNALASERILLWSLGLDPIGTPEPRAAIVYGRARWMGPLMHGEEISAPNVVGLLSIIGADCECGLDVAWTLGTRLPVRWEEAQHARVARALGFDPENPLVKLEVGRIAARSGVPRPAPAADPTVLLSSDPRPHGADVSAGVAPPADGADSPLQKPLYDPGIPAGQTAVLLRGWGFLGGLAVLVLGTCACLLWNARRRGTDRRS